MRPLAVLATRTAADNPTLHGVQEHNDEWQLAAILAADVVASSCLKVQDGAGTRAAIRLLVRNSLSLLPTVAVGGSDRRSAERFLDLPTRSKLCTLQRRSASAQNVERRISGLRQEDSVHREKLTLRKIGYRPSFLRPAYFCPHKSASSKRSQQSASSLFHKMVVISSASTSTAKSSGRPARPAAVRE
jgi:hypothetical protein